MLEKVLVDLVLIASITCSEKTANPFGLQKDIKHPLTLPP
ncbi:hypothetical protein DGWBC_0948 [Dehalogenimonas sp. WBC-2]|nr:hypothetical protein DGWBC_0948 [Dehalogenimonas sp. WBC-2]